MADLFRAYKVGGAAIPGYFIESTAPDNLDDRFTAPPPLPALTPLPPDDAIAEVVDHLAGASDPSLVIMIHGFNNPRKVVLDRYATAFDAVNQDPAVVYRRGLVCIGYRWPSERIGTPLWTAFSAAPRFLIGLLVVGILLLVVAQGSALGLGAFLLAISITAILLYIAVYFRDGYRATSYGIPDLVEIIRQIDKKLTIKEGGSGRKNWVELSFIGHSMGAYVVTSVVRILSDVFAPASVKPGLQVGVTETDGMFDATSELRRLPPEIGNVFRLMRLLLVSPDIPAEALVSDRANFLASSLSRFKEAYLFSSEGDEVLRQISTTANYFSFPTRSRNFGFRLGNVGVLANDYGIVGRGTAWGLCNLRIGYLTLQEIYRRLAGASGTGQLQDDLPRYFTYFDCTDYVDNVKGVRRGVLTLAKPGVPNRMGSFGHLWLLLHAAVRRWPDVHGGYFDAAFSTQLIYRLICLGFQETVRAYGDVAVLSAECETRQIKSLLSPGL